MNLIGGVIVGELYGGERGKECNKVDSSLLFFFLLLVIIFGSCDWC